MSAALRVLNGGVLLTVQDAGRDGYQRFGVPRGGAMDQAALVIANRLVGNAPDAAALEITAGGAAFELLAPTVIALAGADLGAALHENALPLWTALFVRPGDRLAFAGRAAAWGARVYLAIAGGIEAPIVLGSRSAYLGGGWDGVAGRSLRAGDELAAGVPARNVVQLAGRSWPLPARPAYRAAPTLRFVPGPHREHFAADALELFVQQPWAIGANSNRIGYRLEGSRLHYTGAPSLPSLGVLPGALQVPPDGMPILLMADAQATGGYPILGVVIAADLPLAAQLLPGDRAHFRAATVDEARLAWQQHVAALHAEPERDPAELLLGWAGAA